MTENYRRLRESAQHGSKRHLIAFGYKIDMFGNSVSSGRCRETAIGIVF